MGVTAEIVTTEPQAAFLYRWLSYNMPDNCYLTVVKEGRSINSERQQRTGAEKTWDLSNTQEEASASE